jgi:alkanesulfonate monooxygenase SsuD/methylene tetrahydromethanopterin reductase-like flavin-dependent oxidoreductase (luciferase family)
MEFGLFTEFASPPGVSDAAAFDASLGQMRAAEDMGFDAVWLAEIHFQKDRSVLASPLVIAAALAAGKYFQFQGVCIMPKPYQKPHRRIRIAATTPETYPLVGRLGAPVFEAVRTVSLSDLKRHLPTYQAARTAAGRVLTSMRLFAERVAPRLA